MRWAKRQQILDPFSYVGEHGEFGPIYKHRGALSLEDKEALTHPWTPQDAALSTLSSGGLSTDDNSLH